MGRYPGHQPDRDYLCRGTAPLVSAFGLDDEMSAPSGATTTITGSFASSPAALQALVTNVVYACSSTWGPYSAFTFGSPSSLNITYEPEVFRHPVAGTPPSPGWPFSAS